MMSCAAFSCTVLDLHVAKYVELCCVALRAAALRTAALCAAALPGFAFRWE